MKNRCSLIFCILIFFSNNTYAQLASDVWGIVDNVLVTVESSPVAIDDFLSIPDLAEERVRTLAFFPEESRFYGIIKSSSEPTLIWFDLCGDYAIVGPLMLNGVYLPMCEAFAFNPVDNQFYGGVSLDGNPDNNDYVSEAIVAIDHNTAQCTFIAEGNADLDAMEFVDDYLYISDTDNGSTIISRALFSTIASPIAFNTILTESGDIFIVDLAHGEGADTIYCTAGHNLYALDLSESPLSLDWLGQTHEEDEYDGKRMFGLTSTSYNATNTTISCLPPVADFTVLDTIICAGQCIDFFDNSLNSPTQWAWTFAGAQTTASSSTDPEAICFHTSGLYEVQLIISNELGADTVSKTIEVLEIPTINLGKDTTLCGQSELLLSVTDPSATTVVWSTGETSNSINIASAGTYWVDVSNGLCMVSDTIEVNYTTPMANLGPDITICDGEEELLDVFQAGASYEWQDGSSAAIYTVSETAWYSVNVSIGDCVSTDSVYVEVLPIPMVNLGNDTTLCGQSELLLSVTDPSATTVVWSTGETSNSINITSAATYWVDVSNGLCMVSDTIMVDSLAAIDPIDIGMDTTLCFTTDLLINLDVENATHLEWSNNEQGPSIQITETGAYYVVASNDCESVTSNTIHVAFEDCNCALYVPNAFSPNEDGVNDEFLAFSNCEILEYNLKVFDRWGGLVFESNDLNQAWDGRVQADSVTPAVYVYLIEAVAIKGGLITNIQLTGDVTLVK